MDAQSEPVRERLAFGPFEADLHTGELWRAGVPVRLQPQPFHVLSVLLRSGGELVTREHLRRALWGEDTFVDFDQGLGFCIRQVRAALDDDARRPRYIETLPRRGFRFLVPVERGSRATAPQDAALESDATTDAGAPGIGARLGRFVSRLAGTTQGRARARRGALLTIASLLVLLDGGGPFAAGAGVAARFEPRGGERAASGRVRVVVHVVRAGEARPVWAQAYDLEGESADALGARVAEDLGRLSSPRSRPR